MSTPTNNWR